ncbi:ImmA/IrrE family metallo-endopeptidase [Micromonospora sp. AMSO1212t]|uniref:ImmA/IrrE family metallo-endopeptidase n=1 Tax=Micromonospora sp. AMSO1212t TaxID=2650565 RepID=UPI00124BBB4B|nr:ImmA/IrrE family metallo-endopeptidase [Micromonospora sp. AMSO1212t]
MSVAESFDLQRLTDGRYLTFQVKAAVQRLCDNLDQVKPGAVSRLQADAWHEVSGWADVIVREVYADIAGGCSVAGHCNLITTPAEITVVRNASHGRRIFTLLHEIAHFLQQNDELWTDGALSRQQDFGRRLEEQVCDAFAAEVLLGNDLPDRIIGASPITASLVQQLFEASQASRSACCVKVAQLLPCEGWVLLTDLDGTVQFAAVSGNRIPPRRGTYQGSGHVSQVAGRLGTSRQEDSWVAFPSGRRWRPLYADSVRDPSFRYVYTVLTEDVPPWLPSYTQRRRAPADTSWDCHVCEAVFNVRPASCAACNEPTCPRCGMCACEQRVHERRCERCFLVHGIAMFEGSSSVCRECS